MEKIIFTEGEIKAIKTYFRGEIHCCGNDPEDETNLGNVIDRASELSLKLKADYQNLIFWYWNKYLEQNGKEPLKEIPKGLRDKYKPIELNPNDVK